MVQATNDNTRRIHLDSTARIATPTSRGWSDVGAEEVSRSHHWVVLRDLAGVTFCVVQHGQSPKPTGRCC